jgi:hypothetical protein
MAARQTCFAVADELCSRQRQATCAGLAFDVFVIQQDDALPAGVAEVSVTRVEPKVYVPPIPGAHVQRASAPS